RRAGIPPAVRLHRAHLAPDERAGAVAARLAEPVPLAELRGRVREGTALALRAQHGALRRPGHTRSARLEHPRRLRALAAAVARAGRRLRRRARDDDAAAAGHDRAGLRALGEAA